MCVCVCFNINLSLFKSKLSVTENRKELKSQVLSLNIEYKFWKKKKKSYWNIFLRAIASHFWWNNSTNNLKVGLRYNFKVLRRCANGQPPVHLVRLKFQRFADHLWWWLRSSPRVLRWADWYPPLRCGCWWSIPSWPVRTEEWKSGAAAAAADVVAQVSSLSTATVQPPHCKSPGGGPKMTRRGLNSVSAVRSWAWRSTRGKRIWPFCVVVTLQQTDPVRWGLLLCAVTRAVSKRLGQGQE